MRALLCLVLVVACGSDGYTPSCPARPLYDITSPSQRTSAEVLRAEREAIDAGCLTARGEPSFSSSGGSSTGGNETYGGESAETTGGSGEEPVAGVSGDEP